MEGVMEFGRLSPLSPNSLPITPCLHSMLVPIIPPLRFSHAREFPIPHLALLGKPVEEAEVSVSLFVAM